MTVTEANGGNVTGGGTYDDGTESDYSDLVYVTPFAQTVHEEMWDDGSAESSVNAGSGQFLAVKYTACSAGESLVRFKWYQTEEAGAFYLKVFDDDGGMPGAEVFSAVQASGNADGWNEKDLSSLMFNYGEERFSKKIARAPAFTADRQTARSDGK